MPLSATATAATARSQARVSSTCLLVAAGLVLAGCGEKKSVVKVTPEDLKPINPEASAETLKNQRVKMGLAIRDGIMPDEPALKLKGGEPATSEVLDAYNQLLLRTAVQRREFPESLEELKKWPVPKLPTPPAGKRIIFDIENCIVRLDPP
jgi:hypothetical protein